MITRFVNNLKLSTRSCLLSFSLKNELPSELDRFVSTLNRARVIAIKMDSKQPTIERADKLAALMSEALSLARRFHGVKVHSGVYANVERVRRLLTPSVRMAKALVRAIEDTMSDSDDESDEESGSENEVSDSESDSESGDSSSEEESSSDEEELLDTPQQPLQADSDCSQRTSDTIQLKLMPTALPKRPEDCNTEISKDLSELLWKTREEVERKQKKGVLNCTKQNSAQGLKNRGSQIQSQMRASFSKCSKKLTASNISSLMGDLVMPVNLHPAADAPLNAAIPSTHANGPPKGPLEPKSITSPVPTQVQQIISTEDLAKTLDNIFPCVKYEFSKSMSCITEQFSKSSIDTVSSATLDPDTPFMKLRDGPVKFILYPSSLTKVLQWRKKEGQSLKVLNLVPIGQEEAFAVEKNVITPIKESILTSILKDEDTVHTYARVFAGKMQQAVLDQTKAKRQIHSVGRVILTVKRAKRVGTDLSTDHPVIVASYSRPIFNRSAVRGYLSLLLTIIQRVASTNCH